MRHSTRSLLLCGASAVAMAFSQQVAEAADVLAPVTYDPTDLWYVSLFGGASFGEDLDYDGCYTSDFDPGDPPGPCVAGYSGSAHLDTGYIVGAAIGIDSQTHPGFRFEVEFAKQNWSVATLDFAHGPGYPTYYGSYSAEGDVGAFTILADVWYDFEEHQHLTPYIGGGIGVGFVDPDVHFIDPDPTTDGEDNSVFGLFDDSAGFAFQVGAGVRWAAAPGALVDISYRFRGITGLDFDQRISGFDLADPAALQESHFNGDLFSHAVQVGLTLEIPPH